MTERELGLALGHAFDQFAIWPVEMDDGFMRAFPPGRPRPRLWPGSVALTLLRLVRLVIPGVIIVAARSAMSSGPAPQDACRIGAVSPEEIPDDRHRDAALPAIG